MFFGIFGGDDNKNTSGDDGDEQRRQLQRRNSKALVDALIQKAESLDELTEPLISGDETHKESSSLFTAPTAEDTTGEQPAAADAEEEEAYGMYGDTLSEMTYSRRIARYLSKYDWYYPRRDIDDGVSLDDGWAYFEHITLYRHRKLAEGEDPSDGLDKADPGEKQFPTELYGYWSTPNDQLGDFGIGIGVYFSTTWFLAIITFIAGCISIPNIVYYYSDDYTSEPFEEDHGVLIESSATCSDQIWVPCVDCVEDDWTDDKDRYIVATNASGSEQVFVLHNDCVGAELEQGIVTLIAIVFLSISLWLLSRYMQRVEVAFDEDEQTAQDYSLVVDDCPPDAMDPEEWRAFFSRVSGDNVTCVTISIDNGDLVNCLVQHRLEKRRLRYLLQHVMQNTSLDLDFDDEAHLKLLVENTPRTSCWKRPLQTLGLMHDARSCFAKIKKLNRRIRELSAEEYEATDIFVTFETEAGQRKALSSLSTGKLAIAMQKGGGITDDLKFRGEILLDVAEPAEPSAVRWNDIATHWQTRLRGLLISTILTFLLLALAAYVVLWRNEDGDPNVALYIAGMNVVFPLLTRAIVDYEVHSDEGGRALSLYFKITLFRWVNTAIIIMASTPFTSTISDKDEDLIPRVYTIFFAELISAPSIALVDIVGFFMKHYMAPRALSQEELNNNFRGTKYELAERYATVTKLLFLAFFYASIFPVGYFICSASLIIAYYTDKFCLLRIWRPAPQLGNEVAEFSREYFFPVVVLALALVNGYLYAMFPYDNVCETDDLAGTRYAGNYSYTPTDDPDATVHFTVAEGDALWEHCKQNIVSEHYFPLTSDVAQPEGSEWMTDEQEDVVDILGWNAVAILIVVVMLKYFWSTIDYIVSWFKSTYEPSGDDQNIEYSAVPSISAYVPQVVDDEFNFPLLACKIDCIDPRLIGWSDPLRPHDFWNLIHEFPADLEEKARNEEQPILSIVKHYPPKHTSSENS
mmetsp:Transcript_2051/g.3256  ORF Transcript_2051/g.3256 Transcript_2051/m.3256 type:complete len:974 (-) Transcript_2051:276-3197(-)|eukprot:CAMPEP_0196817728 /NCGR_PEP_ID=MMETSP1362-20130617/62454_1 /TAXON_ID=163516 /ORGANISM="Leptocylindrus danicus, Strain CCMP1856" /LENGTH=973 /DNA_ID=CAMNT_0042195551 /DNA_START=35 /DNA_END=2956 /DNA_ORIENTATION=-